MGIKPWQIQSAMRKGKIVRLRKGWYALAWANPMERQAVSDRGLLTCSSAAAALGLPVVGDHYHLRVTRGSTVRETNNRRRRAEREGGIVSTVDWLEDHLACQPEMWSLAVLDALARREQISERELSELADRVSESSRKLLGLVDARAESALESIMRYRLIRARVPHEIQVQLGRFRADFVIGSTLIVETHGAEFHAGRADWERDRERVVWLKSQGWDVLEVSFRQVIEWEKIWPIIDAHARRRSR